MRTPAESENMSASESIGGSGRKLHRSTSNCIIAGVCGGLAEWLGWSPTMVRILYVTISLVSAAFPGMLVYLILWFVMPKRR